jgi:hypothetical protein
VPDRITAGAISWLLAPSGSSVRLLGCNKRPRPNARFAISGLALQLGAQFGGLLLITGLGAAQFRELSPQISKFLRKLGVCFAQITTSARMLSPGGGLGWDGAETTAPPAPMRPAEFSCIRAAVCCMQSCVCFPSRGSSANRAR